MPIVGTQCPVLSFGQKKLLCGQSIINGEQPSPLQCAGCRLPPTLCRRTNLGCEAVRQCIANGRLPTANWKLEIGNEPVIRGQTNRSCLSVTPHSNQVRFFASQPSRCTGMASKSSFEKMMPRTGGRGRVTGDKDNGSRTLAGARA